MNHNIPAPHPLPEFEVTMINGRELADELPIFLGQVFHINNQTRRSAEAEQGIVYDRPYLNPNNLDDPAQQDRVAVWTDRLLDSGLITETGLSLFIARLKDKDGVRRDPQAGVGSLFMIQESESDILAQNFFVDPTMRRSRVAHELVKTALAAMPPHMYLVADVHLGRHTMHRMLTRHNFPESIEPSPPQDDAPLAAEGSLQEVRRRVRVTDFRARL